jgi:hypothetical protein
VSLTEAAGEAGCADRALALAAQAEEACALLAAQVQQGLSVRVLDAARAGAGHVDVLRFDGKDLCELTPSRLSYVFLARGPPRSDPLLGELRARGFRTLVERLAGQLAPFEVRHVWDKATHANEIRVQWAGTSAGNRKKKKK